MVLEAPTGAEGDLANPTSSVRSRGALLTQIVRGEQVESVHEAHAWVQTRSGEVLTYGPPDTATFMRSIAKPFQTLALMRAGVHKAYNLTPEELAVISASHAGEQYHHELVANLLTRHGLTKEELQCGIHAPYSGYERRRRVASGEPLSVLGNNCSGKHSGMLLFARHLEADSKTYLDPEHPIQVQIRTLLEAFLGEELPANALGTDGCGTPTFHRPLASMARAFLRLHDAAFLEAQGLSESSRELHDALHAHPRAFSGDGRLPAGLTPILGKQLWSKEGAEGVFVIWGRPGVVLIKSSDGHERGYRHALIHVLTELGWLSSAQLARWAELEPREVRNVSGRTVGEIRVVVGSSA